ncbi:MAG: xanthine dehydrogenase family protein subunit M [Thermoplasmata archaeon]|nr:xanthine dehydrogenase family protein subunit M [Candidatus Sysuiplasma acidicola]
MTAEEFEYVSPRNMKSLLGFLKLHGAESKILAGGMSLIPIMKMRFARPKYLVDINRLKNLSYIKFSGDSVLIGALTRHHDIESSSQIRKKLQIMSETASQIGDPQVRNRGTIGGSLAHADPAGDWGATVLALRGRLEILSASGSRKVDSDSFFLDTFTTAVKPDEILAEIQITVPKGRNGGAYVKFERRSGDFAIVGAGTHLALDENGICTYAGIGLTAVGNVSLRAKESEEILLGKKPDDGIVEKAARAAAEAADPSSDLLRGSAEFRKEMTAVHAKKAIQSAISRARQVG